jgi:predicted 2-oxoglutarate/Fe(II)-dependent dioxygenase YbiX
MKSIGKRKRPSPNFEDTSTEDLYRNEDDLDDNRPAPPNNIGIFDNVLSQQECQELIAIHNSHRHAGYIHHLTITRVADLVAGGANTLHLLGLVLPLVRARHAMWRCVEEYFDCLLELYPEFTVLVAWHTGSFLQTHFDANRDYLQDRHFSAVLYLNDPRDEVGHVESGESLKIVSDKTAFDQKNFEGGDLVLEFPSTATTTTRTAGTACVDDHINIPKQDYRVRPKAGRLVCFPSTVDYPHRVDPVTRGTRYSLTMWFTRNESAMETLQSLQQQLLWVQQPVFSNLLDDDNWVWWNSCSTLFSDTLAGSQQPQQQPWETPQQASQLLNETMAQAQLEWNDEMKCWYLPALMEQAVNGEVCTLDTRIRSMLRQTPWLLSLISHSWWKRDKALGILTNKELIGLITEWQAYLQCRFVGLRHASRRWIDQGMITNVAAFEMDLEKNNFFDVFTSTTSK